MTLWARVTTDGSCIPGPGGVGAGGWAAVVERGSEGWVVRGRVPATTSTSMELRAAIEGLRSLPDDTPVALFTDSSLVMSVHDRWRRKEMPAFRRVSRLREGALWIELALEFQRTLELAVEYVCKRDMNLQHRRCHAIAQAEARAQRRGVVGEIPMPEPPAVRARAWFVEQDPLRAYEARERRRRRRAAARAAA